MIISCRQREKPLVGRRRLIPAPPGPKRDNLISRLQFPSDLTQSSGIGSVSCKVSQDPVPHGRPPCRDHHSRSRRASVVSSTRPSFPVEASKANAAPIIVRLLNPSRREVNGQRLLLSRRTASPGRRREMWTSTMGDCIPRRLLCAALEMAVPAPWPGEVRDAGQKSVECRGVR